MGGSYTVAFRLGTVLAGRRVKLQSFELARRPQEASPGDRGRARGERLIHTNINLWIGEPMVLGLAQTEASEEALMVIVSSTLEGAEPAVVARGGE